MYGSFSQMENFWKTGALSVFLPFTQFYNTIVSFESDWTHMEHQICTLWTNLGL